MKTVFTYILQTMEKNCLNQEKSIDGDKSALEVLYEVIVEFIEWYNKESGNTENK